MDLLQAQHLVLVLSRRAITNTEVFQCAALDLVQKSVNPNSARAFGIPDPAKGCCFAEVLDLFSYICLDENWKRAVGVRVS